MSDEKKEETNQEVKKQESNFFTKAENLLTQNAELVRRNEAAVNQMKILVARNEELAARNLLGGGTDATPQEQKKELTAKEFAQKVMKGEIKLEGF